MAPPEVKEEVTIAGDVSVVVDKGGNAAKLPPAAGHPPTANGAAAGKPPVAPISSSSTSSSKKSGGSSKTAGIPSAALGPVTWAQRPSVLSRLLFAQVSPLIARGQLRRLEPEVGRRSLTPGFRS